MTTKPKTRKAPAAGTGISPKMMECGSTTTFSISAPKTGKAPAANGAEPDPVLALTRESGSVSG
jgi:hypothetical protein